MTIPAVKPRYVLAVYLGLCFVFGVAATLTHGATSVALLILVLCFESACFATIFSLGLRGLGRHTKRGGSMLVAAISGGAAIPPATGALATATGNFHTAMAIPTAFYVCAWIYPIYANTINAKNLDGHRDTDLNVSSVDNAVKGVEEGRGGSVSEAIGNEKKAIVIQVEGRQ
jgi:FHS family L-fucose permease-like MFS transporter